MCWQALEVLDMRGPYDVAAIAAMVGLSRQVRGIIMLIALILQDARAAVGDRCGAVVRHGHMRKHTYKGAVELVAHHPRTPHVTQPRPPCPSS